MSLAEILFLGDPMGHAFELVLLTHAFIIRSFGVLHHTLHGCVALAQQIDAVTPYIVACIGR